jgi:hypothetical protein
MPEFVELPLPNGGTALINTDNIKRLGAVFSQAGDWFIEIQIGSTETSVGVPFECSPVASKARKTGRCSPR